MESEKNKGMSDMRPVENESIRTLLGSLSIKQVWGGLMAFFVVIGAAAGFGAFIQEIRNENRLGQVEILLGDMGTEISSLKLTNNEITNSAKEDLDELTGQFNRLHSKTRFLQQFLAYSTAIEDDKELAKNSLVGLVCAMWKEDVKNRITLEKAPLVINYKYKFHQIQQDSELERYLTDNRMLEHSEIYKIRTAGEACCPRNYLDKVEEKLKNLGSIYKVVKFSENESYILPYEIGAAIHNRENCNP